MDIAIVLKTLFLECVSKAFYSKTHRLRRATVYLILPIKPMRRPQ